MQQPVSRATVETAPATTWAGYAGCVWALAYVPIHLYWALTGSLRPFGELPGSLTETAWRQGNWAASVVITGAALECLALVQPWGHRLPRPILLGVARVGAGFAVLHWVAYTAAPLLIMLGLADGEVTRFDRWNVLVFEPWFLGMGVLLATAARQNHRRHRETAVSQPTDAAAPPPPVGKMSSAFVSVGALVVLLGVMAFDVWTFAVVGPSLIGIGALLRLRTGRRRRQA